MKSFRQHLLIESITSTDVQKWISDAKAFLINFDRIKSDADLVRVRNAFHIFRENMYDFYFKRILGANANIGQMPFSKLTADLNEKGNIFIEQTADIFTGSYAEFKSESAIRKQQYRDAINPLLKSLETLIKEVDNIDDKYAEFDYTVAGIPVISYAKEKEENHQKLLQKYNKIIINSVSALKKKKLAKVLAGLKIRIDLQRYPTKAIRAANGAGAYSANKDLLWLFPTAVDEYILLHELGHRFFYILSSQAQKTWNDWILKRMTYFTQREIYEIESAFEKSIGFIKKSQPELLDLDLVDTWEGQEFLWTVTGKFLDNELTKRKLAVVLKLRRGMDMVSSGQQIDKFLQQIIDTFVSANAKGQKFMLDFQITSYANTNPSEAYAETFAMYCLDRSLPGEVGQMFRIVSGLE